MFKHAASGDGTQKATLHWLKDSKKDRDYAMRSPSFYISSLLKFGLFVTVFGGLKIS